ncbi:MAG: acetyltransferase [Akkermansia sp.]
MKHLIIVGAGGWGREVYATALYCDARVRGEWDIKGFLDSRPHALDDIRGAYPPILGSPEEYTICPGDIFFIAQGFPQWRRHYAEILEAKGAEFATIIAPGALVNETAAIGAGSFVAPWSILSDNVTLGKHCIVHPFCNLGHDVRVGDYGTIEAYCFLGGGSSVGDDSILHVRSTVIRCKRVGQRAEVGSGSVVIRHVPDDTHVFGNPAVRLKF